MKTSLVPRNQAPGDRPPWEENSIIDVAIKSWKKPATFAGPVQRFAPLSRFIRVVNRKDMFFTNGLKATPDVDDPMKAYSRPDEKENYEAVELRRDRASWRDAHTLFSLGSSVRKPPASLNHIARLVQDRTIPNTARPKANVVGVATDRGRKYLWRHERMPAPTALLATADLVERLGGLLQKAELAGIELNTRARRIAKLYLAPDAESPGGRLPDREELARVADVLDPRPAYWARLEKHFFALLENLPDDWDADRDAWKPDDQQAATNTWQEDVKEEARRALEESIRSLGATARAIQAVARVRTNFNDADLEPHPRNATKPARKSKGGTKQ